MAAASPVMTSPRYRMALAVRESGREVLHGAYREKRGGVGGQKEREGFPTLIFFFFFFFFDHSSLPTYASHTPHTPAHLHLAHPCSSEVSSRFPPRQDSLSPDIAPEGSSPPAPFGSAVMWARQAESFAGAEPGRVQWAVCCRRRPTAVGPRCGRQLAAREGGRGGLEGVR
jgi:hypothetical protein